MSGNSDAARFVELWTQNTRRVFTYILSLVADWADAEEILQETSKLAWEKFHTFDEGTNFLSWTRSIAYYKVLEHRRSSQHMRFVLGEAAMQKIDAIFTADAEDLDQRADALPRCLEKLPQCDREIIELRYQANVSVASIAADLGRTAGAVYKALHRIHGLLQKCIERAIAGECSS